MDREVCLSKALAGHPDLLFLLLEQQAGRPGTARDVQPLPRVANPADGFTEITPSRGGLSTSPTTWALSGNLKIFMVYQTEKKTWPWKLQDIALWDYALPRILCH